MKKKDLFLRGDGFHTDNFIWHVARTCPSAVVSAEKSVMFITSDMIWILVTSRLPASGNFINLNFLTSPM